MWEMQLVPFCTGPSSTVLMCSCVFHKNKSYSFTEVIQSVVGFKFFFLFFFSSSLMFIACTAPLGIVFFCFSTYHDSLPQLFHKFCFLLLQRACSHSTLLFLGKSLITDYGWFNYQHLLHEEEAEIETRKKGQQSDHLLLPKKVVLQVFHVHFQLMTLAKRTH